MSSVGWHYYLNSLVAAILDLCARYTFFVKFRQISSIFAEFLYTEPVDRELTSAEIWAIELT